MKKTSLIVLALTASAWLPAQAALATDAEQILTPTLIDFDSYDGLITTGPEALGGGITFCSSQTPNRNPPGIVAPGFVTGDLMAQYNFSDAISLMVNVTNVTNRYYADSLYSGHYVPGAPRNVKATLTARF